MEQIKIIAQFDGGYSREGEIWLAEADCDVCGKRKVCICIDGSDAEYNCGKICKECVNQHL